MSTRIRVLTLFLALLAGGAAQANASVDSVNFPVWVKRGVELDALAPGARLQAGDEVRTGAGGRAWLEFDDGSVVKLGQQARFVIERARFEDSAGGSLLDAAFDVLRGAFRFTSGFFAARREAGHRVDLKVGAITLGVRGTDIWGRSAADQDFVALLEGSIEVSSEGDAPQIMDQPLTLYAKPRGQPAGPVQSVDMATVQSLAPETELDPAAGIANRDGGFALVLMSLRDEDLVQANIARFEQAGYPVEPRRAEVGGQAYTRLVVGRLADRTAADNLRAAVAERFGLVGVWITRQR